MIRSLHVIGSRRMGGAERFFSRLLEGLRQQGHPAGAVIRPKSPLTGVLEESIPQFQVPMRNGWDLPSLLALKRLIRRLGVPIIQTYMGRATRLTRVPRPSVHVARLGGYYKVNGYYKHADAWVANTKGICDYLMEQGLPCERIYHIGNFVEIPERSNRQTLLDRRRGLGIPEEAQIIFSLGRLVEKKGMADLLAAFGDLPDRIHDRPLHLVIAGGGPLARTLQRQTRILGLADRVHWVGWQDDPRPFYDMATIFVCPSRIEPLGNVILEAWAHHLPVVSTRTRGALENVADGETGLLTPIASPGPLAETIRRLLQDDRLRDTIAAEGKAQLSRRFNKARVLSAYLEMYEELLRRFA
jgi:glycosyltransferase involved in cell wall biosynthesis